MRIAIGGIHLEASTFTLQTCGVDDFEVRRGDEILRAFDLDDWLGADRAAAIEWVPLVHAIRGANGPIRPDDWDALETELLDLLRAAGPVDGVWLTIHGATNVLGRDGAEERLAARVREIVGPDCVLSASMDPHGNMSRELAATLDLAACHREAPHVDNRRTLERAITNLVTVLERGERPHKAWVRIPSLLPGERTSTVVEPGRTVFGAQTDALDGDAVLDAALYVGFAWADEPRCSAAAIVTGWDASRVEEVAADLARSYWDARDDFRIVVEHSGSIDEAWDHVARATGSVWISDSGDNVTAGGSGDITFAAHALRARPDVLESGRRFLFAGYADPESLDAAIRAGIGGTVDRAVGAVVDDRFGPSLAGSWTVEQLVPGDDGVGIAGALLVDGPVAVSVQRTRSAFTDPLDPSFPRGVARGRAWVDPAGFDVVVVKNGYQFPSQIAHADTSFLAFTPGGTDLDPDRLGIERWSRPMYPLDRDFEPDLTPERLR